ncbi:MAG: hypothetical protein OXU23_17580 [Candidatus Poribacteria bacterium]|nr:hypothetical protein [Candidatus Poribacteria bacterium]
MKTREIRLLSIVLTLLVWFSNSTVSAHFSSIDTTENKKAEISVGYSYKEIGKARVEHCATSLDYKFFDDFKFRFIPCITRVNEDGRESIGTSIHSGLTFSKEMSGVKFSVRPEIGWIENKYISGDISDNSFTAPLKIPIDISFDGDFGSVKLKPFVGFSLSRNLIVEEEDDHDLLIEAGLEFRYDEDTGINLTYQRSTEKNSNYYSISFILH